MNAEERIRKYPLQAESLKVYDAIEEYYSLQGVSPSYNDLMGMTGLKSKNTIAHHIDRLKAAGWITHQPDIDRSAVPVHYPRVHYRLKENDHG